MNQEEQKEPSVVDGWVDFVRLQGDKVSIHTEECVLWGLSHPNCFGCPSELGCGKALKLAMVSMLPMMYQPKSFEDFQRMETRIQELQERVTNCKTPEELKEVPSS